MEGGDGWFSFMPPPSEVITISETSTDNNDSDTEVDVDDEDDDDDDDDEQHIIVISDEEDAGEQCMFIYTYISYVQLYSSKQIGENKNFSLTFYVLRFMVHIIAFQPSFHYTVLQSNFT